MVAHPLVPPLLRPLLLLLLVQSGHAVLASAWRGRPERRIAGLDNSALVQLQLHVQAADHQPPENAWNHVDLCIVQDNRCFDRRLEVPAEVPVETAVRFAEIVVTRAGEDVRWLDALPEVPAVVYDRGGSPALLPRQRNNLRVVPQANIGREDDEMLRHILQSYDDLPNVTVFLQGWPLLHCAGVVETVRRTLRAMREPAGGAQLGNGALPGLVPLASTFYEYSEPEGLLGYTRAMAEAQEAGDDVMERALVPYAKTCRAILGRPCPERQWVAEGAQWAVSRGRLRARPRELYQRTLALGEGYHGKLRGLVLEAIWPLLWGADGWAPTALAAPAAATMGPQAEAVSALLLQEAPTQSRSPEPGGPVDAEWCQRWYWTWVCDQAGLPAAMHRRRRRRLNPYGSYSKSALRSTGGHCAAADGNDALQWSCEDRMAFCELQRHAGAAAGPSLPPPGQPTGEPADSHQFLLQRQRFHVHGDGAPHGSAAESGARLEMLVRLRAALLAGAPTYVEAVAGAGATGGASLRLRHQDAGVAGTLWYLEGVPWGTGVRGVGALVNRTFALSTTVRHGSTRFLACDGAAGEARLAPARAAWELLAAPDGLVRLRAPSTGGLLRFGEGPIHQMLCMPDDKSDASVFSLELEEHAPPLEW